ncbi:MAG: hypothetical protein U9N81_11660 [Bacillota bacterium]|nr:hypothetical protein [Bacillota bacterium]
MSQKWLLEIGGKIDDLERMIGSKFKGKFQFLKLNNRFFIKSEGFNECEYVEEVLRQGEEIIKIINGIAEVNLSLSSKIEVLGATVIDEEMQNIVKNYRHSSLEGVITIRSELNNENKPENSLENWIELSEIDENVVKVFKLLNYRLDSFFNMYRVYEIIKNDLGKSYLRILEIDKSEIDRFTGSANRPDASGELARHGYLSGEPMFFASENSSLLQK